MYVLLTASFLFYAFDSPTLLLLLLLSGTTNALSSYGAIYWKYSRFYATLGVVINLLLLGLFKYGGLISLSFLNIDDGIGKLLCSIPLPLGISFYTFSGISLVVDSYKNKLVRPCEVVSPSISQHVRKTLLYICFFPKLLAGPIVKSKEFFSQISPKRINSIDLQFIFKSLVVGYFLKMVIADNLKDFTFWMVYPYFELQDSVTLCVMVFGYSIQMFADFAGYSLIAIGVAALFGYRLPTNFYFPYISASFREFWKRWHITLSQFLMEYLYISLGGNRKGKFRTYTNLLLTMMLGGLWHGAAWSYLVWGTYHGLCLVVERIICGRRPNCISVGNGRIMIKASRFISILFVFVMVSFGWLLFKLPNFNDVVKYIQCIFISFDTGGLKYSEISKYIIIYSFPVIIYHILYCFRTKLWMQKYIIRFDHLFYGIMLFLILTNSGSANSFVYFQF